MAGEKKRLLSCSMLTVSRVTNNILTGNRSDLILRDQVIASVNIIGRMEGIFIYMMTVGDKNGQSWGVS